MVEAHNITLQLFPKRIRISNSQEQTAPIVWFNKNIMFNPEQQQAVTSILLKSSMPAPYLLFGPPGTGKTMTVVEAVKQIYARTNSNVLICTPSNNAANEIAKRLVADISTKDLFRVMASHFPFHLIPDDVKKYVNYTNGIFYPPEILDLLKYRIIITTLVSAAKLINGGCPSGHFSYVFIDESGQATESETLIPIAGILSSKSMKGNISGQIVLVGDPRQLGPVIQSPLAAKYGYGK